MHAVRKDISVKTIQWIIWAILFAIHIVVLLPYDVFGQAVVYSLINVGSYMLIMYGNALWLLPALYEKGYKTGYVLAAILFIIAAIVLKYGSAFYVYNWFFAKKPETFRWSGVMGSMITVVLVFVSSILFYMALHFFRLKQQQDALQKQHAQAQLDLLKAQVQPHFLFNTLNNIYFVAQRESPVTAALLDKLSQIMRYFVDDAPKASIPIGSELGFVTNYIELEKMRMRYPLEVSIHRAGVDDGLMVPPMLLIPLVENVFKHGVDKQRMDNFIDISLVMKESRLQVTVENLVAEQQTATVQSGVGLRNLQERLQLLYAYDAGLQVNRRGNIFHATFDIPVR